MNSGEFISGEIIAIGSDVMLVKSSDRVFSVNRADIKYVFTEPRTPSVVNTSETHTPIGSYSRFSPLDRIYLVELAGGLYTFSNYALSMQFVQWIRLNPDWSAGLGLSLDFSRYVMWRASINARRYVPMNEEFKSYLTAAVGIGPQSTYFISTQNVLTTDAEFSAVFQTNAGAGMWYDTGSGVAFTAEGGLSVNRFDLTESFIDLAGETRTQKTNAFNFGPYFRVGMVF